MASAADVLAATNPSAETADDRNPDKVQGVTRAQARHLRVAGAVMNESQREVVNIVLDEAVQVGAGEKAARAMICSGIGESTLDPSKTDYKTHTHKGVFQSGLIPQYHTREQAHYFLVGGRSFAAGGAIGAVKDHPDWSLGTIAAHVEISDGSNAYYDGFAKEANAIVDAWGGIAGGGEADSSRSKSNAYRFTRGKHENSWDAMQRIAGEVNGWDLFAVSNRIYYFSEQALIRQAPVAVVNRTDADVASLSGTFDNTGKATEASLTIFCEPFDFHAGEVVQLVNAGPFSGGKHGGRWIISETSRSIFEQTTELTLKQPDPKGLEPSAGDGGGKAGGSSVSAGVGLEGVYLAAKAIAAKRYPYVWGGGHAHAGTPDTGTPGSSPHDYPGIGANTVGFDCSGSVAAALVGGGYFDKGASVPGSADVPHAAGLKPGVGKSLTVYANPNHIFMHFTMGGNRTVYWGTTHTNPRSGPGFIHFAYPTGGFSPYHVPDDS